MNLFRWLFSSLQESFAGETAGRVHAFFSGHTVSAAGSSGRGTGFMRSRFFGAS
jgi:hypothetical protein